MSTRLPIFGGLIVLAIAGFVWFLGSSNVYTPPGNAGYCTRGAVFGESKFHSVQFGPTSTGRGWMLSCTNVSLTPFTVHENFRDKEAITTRDNLPVSLSMHIKLKVRPTKQSVRDLVERFTTLGLVTDNKSVVHIAYDQMLHAPVQSKSRAAVEQKAGLDVHKNLDAIGGSIFDDVKKMTEGTPFELESVVVGNDQYPDLVANQVANALAATQVEQQKDIEIQIANLEAHQRFIRDQGLATSMDIINGSLTWQYVQFEALQHERQGSDDAANHSVIYAPTGANILLQPMAGK